MADHSSDSDNDEDDFGHDVSPIVSAPLVVMKRFGEVIGPLYHVSLAFSFQILIWCW